MRQVMVTGDALNAGAVSANVGPVPELIALPSWSVQAHLEST